MLSLDRLLITRLINNKIIAVLLQISSCFSKVLLFKHFIVTQIEINVNDITIAIDHVDHLGNTNKLYVKNYEIRDLIIANVIRHEVAVYKAFTSRKLSNGINLNMIQLFAMYLSSSRLSERRSNRQFRARNRERRCDNV